MSRGGIFNEGNVAVVTGAALGIGKALAIRLARLGMSVVMADLPSEDFTRAIVSVQGDALHGPAAVIGVATDVSSEAAIAALHAATLEAFGKIDLLVNNAVTRVGRGFDADIAEWRRAVDVNLWGPIYAVNAFLPSLMVNPGPAAVVNVGSKQGITNPPGHPVYNLSKSALKSYTESLQHELRTTPGNAGDSRVSAHLLVPGWTTTGKAEHKPGAWLPEQVVDVLVERVSLDDFYIVCPDGEVTSEVDNQRILWAAEDITENRPALSRWHPDYAENA